MKKRNSTGQIIESLNDIPSASCKLVIQGMSQKIKGLPENYAGNLVILAGVYPYDSFWDPLIPSIF